MRILSTIANTKAFPVLMLCMVVRSMCTWKCFLPTASKSSEKKLAELEDSQGKVEAELQEKIRNLEKEAENATTQLADFKRRGAVFYHSDMGQKLKRPNNIAL